MEDEHLEFSVIAIFLIAGAVFATWLASDRVALTVHPACIEACNSLALDAMSANEVRCLCGGSGTVREINVLSPDSGGISSP